MKKKIFIILSILVISLISFSIIGFGQTKFYELGQKRKNIEKDKEIVARINNEPVTKGMFEEKVAWIGVLNQGINDSNKKLNNKDAFDKLTEEIVLFKDAENQNLVVSMDEAKKFSSNMRSEFNKTADTQRKTELKEMINGLNISEDQYWNDYAPKSYQRALSIGKLKAKVVNGETDINKINKIWKAYKDDKVKGAKVEILNKDVTN